MKTFLAIALVLIINDVLITLAAVTDLPIYRRILQGPNVFRLSNASNPGYTLVSGLRSHINSLHQHVLFEISFHGQCYMNTPHNELYLRIRINDALLIGDGATTDLSSTDKSDGAYMTSNGTSNQWFQCSKYDLIYTTIGKYYIELVAKTSQSAQISGGVMLIKTTILTTIKDLNLPLITIYERDPESE